MSRLRLKPNAPRLKDYLKIVQNIPGLSELEEREYIKRLRAGDEVSKRVLIEAYLPLVVKWVAPFRGGLLNFSALIEAGNLAMIHGLKEYAETEGIELETYMEQLVTRTVRLKSTQPLQPKKMED